MPQYSAVKADAAVSLRLQGMDYVEIAEQIGYTSGDNCRKAIERRLAQGVTEENRTAHRSLAAARYERLLQGVWVKATDTEHPEHITAMRAARELIDRLVALNGAAVPAEVVVHTPVTAELQAWVASIMNRDAPQVEEVDVLGMPALSNIEEAEIVTDDDDSGIDSGS